MARLHDLYQPGTSWIHRWQPGAKVSTFLGLICAMALVRQIRLVPVLLAVALGLYGLSRLPWEHLGRRLPYPGLFVLALVAVLPFTTGETVWEPWGGLLLRQEGVFAALLIAGRFISIVITGFTLLSTTPFLAILATLRGWGLPPLLVDMTLLTYRYLYEVMEQWIALRQGMGLRGYGAPRLTQGRREQTRRQWGWLAAVLGSLLLRSYGRSQRIYQAMVLRGYGQPQSQAARSSLTSVVLSQSPDPVTPWLTGIGWAIALGLGFISLSLG